MGGPALPDPQEFYELNSSMSAAFRWCGEQKSYQFSSIHHENLAEKSLSRQDSSLHPCFNERN